MTCYYFSRGVVMTTTLADFPWFSGCSIMKSVLYSRENHLIPPKDTSMQDENTGGISI
jgi:hypothetical protein